MWIKSVVSVLFLGISMTAIADHEPQRLMETSGAADYPIPLISSKQLLVVWNTATEGLRVLTLDRISTVNNSGV